MIKKGREDHNTIKERGAHKYSSYIRIHEIVENINRTSDNILSKINVFDGQIIDIYKDDMGSQSFSNLKG